MSEARTMLAIEVPPASLKKGSSATKPVTNSWAIKILSDISLSETNTDCVGDTREGRIGLSLATMIFDMILYMTEHRLMGRIYVINRGLSSLGIKQI